MEVSVPIAAGTAAVAGAVVGSITSAIALGRKIGQVERDLEVVMADAKVLKQKTSDDQMIIVELRSEMKHFAETLREVRDSIKDIQRNCRSIAATGSCPADPKNGRT